MPFRFPARRRGVLGRLAVTPLLALGLAAGGSAGASAQQAWPGQTWATAAPAAVGMDPALLQQGVGFAAGFGGSGMVVRQGQVVASWGDTNALRNIRSAAKSFGSILLGLAVDDGRVALSDEATDRLPGFGLPPAENGATGWLPLITLEQLATHTAGFEHSDGGYVPLGFQPGTAWAYSDAGSNWLGDVLTAGFGRDLAVVLRERILTPIGVPTSALTWARNTYRPEPVGGVTRRAVSSTISASVDAMARVGLLMARGGEWNGTRVLSSAYVGQAARVPDSIALLEPAAGEDPATANPTRHYGLLWWNNNDGTMRGLPTDAFWAWGLDDAVILVVPSLDLVVARHGPRITDARFGSYAQIAPFLSPIARSVQRANAAPVVNAGPDLALPAPGQAALLGRYGDDGLPGTNSPSVKWSTVSGPAAVGFASTTRTATTATFPAAGTYKLKLVVNDRALKGSDTVTVRVGAGP